MMSVTPLETSVLEKLLARQGEPFDTVRQQLTHSSVSQRRFSGAGFFTHFALPPDAPVRRDLHDTELGGVEAEIAGLQHGAGFLLFIRGGVVSFLEGFSYDERWPETITEFRVFEHQTI
jgi:hypothetical protein